MYSHIHSPDELELVDGTVRPARVRSTEVDRILFLADSKQRISGTPFSFQVSGYRPIYGQTAYISRIMIPKIPNINANNNVFTITNATGTYDITIPIGFYNQVSLVNALQAVLNPFGLPYGDAFTVTYNSLNKTINITAAALPFFFVDSSPFALYGKNVCYFEAFPAGSVLGVVGALSHNSSFLELIYSKYVNILSNRLCSNAVDIPRLSNGRVNVVAAISLAQHYDPQDYDPTGVFTGSILVEQVISDSAVLRIACQKKDLTAIDFTLEDEFGFPLDNALNLGVNYPTNYAGCLIWLTVTL